MPELPEVETVKNGLIKLILNKRVISYEFDWPKSFPNQKENVEEFLLQSKVLSVERKGKVIIINLDSNYSLVIHLKMTGQLVFRGQNINFGAGHPSNSLIGQLPDKSTRVTFNLDDGSKLFFNDQRKFGWVRLLPTIEVPNIDFFKRIGPEPLEESFTWEILKAQLNKRKNRQIKPVLLDQSVLAGIGNIYADESLWMSKIHPETQVYKLTNTKIKLLHESIVSILKLSIKLGGSTDKNYVDAEGKKGSYLEFANVFRRERLPCPRCGTIIIKMKVAGRGTHICPKEQRLIK